MFMLLFERPAEAVDLYAGEGLFSHGLALAGWKVNSVEILDRPVRALHPNITWNVGDALQYDLATCDAGFASPPCQPFSTIKFIAGAGAKSKEQDLLVDTRRRFEESNLPYMIENVAGARKHLLSPLGVCGTMFGLSVARHRLFETSVPPLWHELTCQHDGLCLGTRTRLQRLHKDGLPRYCCAGNMFGVYGTPDKIAGTKEQWADAMGGALFLTAKGLSLSLPAAYGQYMGAMMLAHLVTLELERRGAHAVASQLRADGLFSVTLQSSSYQGLKQIVAAGSGTSPLVPPTGGLPSLWPSTLPPAREQHCGAFDGASSSSSSSDFRQGNVVPSGDLWLEVPEADLWGAASGGLFSFLF